jgi:hypothetical protein
MVGRVNTRLSRQREISTGPGQSGPTVRTQLHPVLARPGRPDRARLIVLLK